MQFSSHSNAPQVVHLVVRAGLDDDVLGDAGLKRKEGSECSFFVSFSRRARARSLSPISFFISFLTRTKPPNPYDRATTNGTPAARREASSASRAGQGRPAAMTREKPEQTPGRDTARSAGLSTANDAATPGLSSAARAATAAARGRPTSAAETRKLLPRSVGVTFVCVEREADGEKKRWGGLWNGWARGGDRSFFFSSSPAPAHPPLSHQRIVDDRVRRNAAQHQVF